VLIQTKPEQKKNIFLCAMDSQDMSALEDMTIEEVREASTRFYQNESERDRKIRMLEYINYIHKNTLDSSSREDYGVYSRSSTFSSSSSGIRNVSEYIRSCESEMDIRGCRSVGLSESKDPSVKSLNQEIILGLSDHKDAHLVMRKNEHAPPPWEAIDLDGNPSRLTALPIQEFKEIEIQGWTRHVFLLDQTSKTVLMESKHKSRVEAVLEDLEPYYLKPYVPETTGDYSKAPIHALVCPSLMSMYKMVKKQCLMDEIDKEHHDHIMAVLYENFRNSGNSMVPLPLHKIHHHIQRDYGFGKHVIEHDDKRGVAVISYAITDRYHLAIFMCVNDGKINLGNQRVAQILFKRGDYGEYEKDGKKDTVSTERQEKGKEPEGEESATHKRKRRPNVSSFFSTGNDNGSALRDKRRRSLISNTTIIERASKLSRREREKRILSLCTNGIVEVAIYSCSCNRGLVRL